MADIPLPPPGSGRFAGLFVPRAFPQLVNGILCLIFWKNQVFFRIKVLRFKVFELLSPFFFLRPRAIWPSMRSSASSYQVSGQSLTPLRLGLICFSTSRVTAPLVSSSVSMSPQRLSPPRTPSYSSRTFFWSSRPRSRPYRLESHERSTYRPGVCRQDFHCACFSRKEKRS